jgi:hypothetical protein
MPHARLNGTAWDKTLNDYSYTRELDLPSMAWEYLRRNEALQCDARASVTAQPIPSGMCQARAICAVDGAFLLPKNGACSSSLTRKNQR